MKIVTTALVLSLSMSLTAEATADCMDADYYASVDPKAAKGVFLAELYTVLSKGTRVYTYGELWELLEITDAADGGDSEVVLLYTQREAPDDKAMKDGITRPGAWNREHTWPQSRGVGKGTTQHSDLHHVRPADYLANNSRGNDNFGDVEGGTEVRGSLGKRAGESIPNVFEPDNGDEKRDVKGDVARMLFYMTVRYPGLQLIEGNAAEGSRDPRLGQLCTLMKWHVADAVSDFEKARNNKICELQGNRNPFIDHPNWTANIWGETCD